MTKKRLFIVSGAVLAVAVAITGGLIFTTRANPEEILYTAISKGSFDAVTSEESTSDDKVKMSAKGFFKKDGTIKVAGSVTCKAPTSLGDMDLDLGITQVQNELFIKFNKISVTGGEDPAFTKQIDDYLQQLVTGKSVLVDDKDTDAASLKEYGTIFGLEGVSSTKVSSDKIIQEMQKLKVMTIANTTDTKVDGKAAIEYDLVVRRSAYEKLIDALIPGYKYKNDVIDSLFTDDTEEISLTVDKKTGSVVTGSYVTDNLCKSFVAQFDPVAADDVTSTTRIKSTLTSDKDVKDAVRPTEFLTQEQFNALLTAEE